MPPDAAGNLPPKVPFRLACLDGKIDLFCQVRIVVERSCELQKRQRAPMRGRFNSKSPPDRQLRRQLTLALRRKLPFQISSQRQPRGPMRDPRLHAPGSASRGHRRGSERHVRPHVKCGALRYRCRQQLVLARELRISLP